ncbi:hypothetical protein MTP99_013987 [Tenebrio molitor]|nr:hypothetical protein MTP99_013987 [Tenebrio molitor]
MAWIVPFDNPKFVEICPYDIPLCTSEAFKDEATKEPTLETRNEWKAEDNEKKITEEVMLAYFLDLFKKIGASSLWPK